MKTQQPVNDAPEAASAQGDAAVGSRPLAAIIARYMAGVLIGGMAVYGCVQYLLLPDKNVLRLVLEHLGHVLFLMILVYATLYWVLFRRVVAPIREFRAKLYRVAGGDLVPLHVTSNITEIREMAEGINLMISRLAGGIPELSLVEFAAHAKAVRELAQQADQLTLEQKEALLNAADRMDALVALIARNSVRQNDAR